jgi:hypothetical protein
MQILKKISILILTIILFINPLFFSEKLQKDIFILLDNVYIAAFLAMIVTPFWIFFFQNLPKDANLSKVISRVAPAYLSSFLVFQSPILLENSSGGLIIYTFVVLLVLALIDNKNNRELFFVITDTEENL